MTLKMADTLISLKMWRMSLSWGCTEQRRAGWLNTDILEKQVEKQETEGAATTFSKKVTLSIFPVVVPVNRANRQIDKQETDGVAATLSKK